MSYLQQVSLWSSCHSLWQSCCQQFWAQWQSCLGRWCSEKEKRGCSRDQWQNPPKHPTVLGTLSAFLAAEEPVFGMFGLGMSVWWANRVKSREGVHNEWFPFLKRFNNGTVPPREVAYITELIEKDPGSQSSMVVKD